MVLTVVIMLATVTVIAILQAHHNATEIATSNAVHDLRVLFAVVTMLLGLFGMCIFAVMVFLLNENGLALSIESVSAMQITIVWVMLIEFALFCGILATAIVVNIAVSQSSSVVTAVALDHRNYR